MIDLYNILKKYKLVFILIGFDLLTKILFYLLLNNKGIIVIIKNFLAIYVAVNRSVISPVLMKYFQEQ